MLQVHYTGRFYKGLTREMQSPSHHTKITYEIGKTYEADEFSVSDEACAGGIHIVTSIAHALKWGPVVVEVEVPEDADVVWSADKLRTPKITVVGISDFYGADLTRANLTGANLTGADLTRAYLTRANLTRAYLTGAHGLPTSGAPEGWELVEGFWAKR